MASERRRGQGLNCSRIQHVAMLLIVLVIIVVSSRGNTFSYGMNVVVDGVENPSCLSWTSNQKQLDVQSCCSYPTTIYLIALLPENWSLTWTVNATRLNPGEWANATMKLQQTNAAGNSSWTFNIRLE
jgi:hypothetical protein